MSPDNPPPPVTVGIEPVLAGATYGDVAEIAALYSALSAEDRRVYHPFTFSPWRLRLVLRLLVSASHRGPAFVRRLPRFAGALVVARDRPGGAIVAIGHARFGRAEDGVLTGETGYFVVADHRRSGVGTLVKRGLIEEIRRRGVRRVEALIDPSNVASIRLNESLGFTFSPERVADRRSPHSRMVRARLDLEPRDPGASGDANALPELAARPRV